MSEKNENKNSLLKKLKSGWALFRERTAISPLTKMRLERFKHMKRANISFKIILVAYLLSLVAEVFMSNRPLLMKLDGKLYFPTYGKMMYAKDHNLQLGDELEIDYRQVKSVLEETGRGWLIMPIVPYNPFETDHAEAPLSITNRSCPVLGVGINKDSEDPVDNRQDYRWIDVSETDGVKFGENADGSKNYVWIKFAEAPNSKRISDFSSVKRNYIGLAWNKKSRMESDDAKDYVWYKIGSAGGLKQPDGKYSWVRFANGSSGEMYHPLAPSLKTKHFLGTDRIGRDILARLFYGYRICMSFSLFFVCITYVLGITVGILMGYMGGMFDTVFQRFIEILEQVPFLYIVMILASVFKLTFGWFLLIFVVFGWSGKTWGARAMTYRERERDYVLAAKSMGASTMRIVSLHILPNIIVIIVTALPFAISGGISSLTSLDYLGYGLRPPTPSWGELLSVGTSMYKEAPWILSSAVTAFVFVLILITFVGEGLREAFDPKRYTVYK